MKNSDTAKQHQFDVVVIGSGFGGAITACRLAQAGRSVCILEKGKRWNRFDFPRGPGEVSSRALADEQQADAAKGFIEYRAFRNMDVIQGTGLGGGSLHYFNVHVQPPAFIFEQDAWPERVKLQTLSPYYKLAANMLGANVIQPTSNRAVPKRTTVFEDAVESLGLKAQRVPICVRLEDQHSPSEPSKAGCDHCGNCLLGCHLHAKNTLDLNYIPLAEKHGAVVLTQHEAINIKPDAQGYCVSCIDHTSDSSHPSDSTKHIQAHQVILAAGTLGTNELLLRCKQTSRTLPRLSPQLGKRFSGNGDFLFAGTHYDRRIVEPGRGPSITSGVGFNKNNQQYVFIEDLGYPDPFIWYFNHAIPTWGRFKRATRQLKHYLGEALGTRHNFQMEDLMEGGFMTNFLPYLGMGTDASDGWFTLDSHGRIRLHWSVRNSLPMFKDMIRHMRDLSEASGGRFINSALWKTPLLKLPLKKTLTAHPLGGCVMSDSPLTGVTNDCGEVWGYKGLYVADGALLPSAVGVNPSATISALAERVAYQMIHQRELNMDEVNIAYRQTGRADTSGASVQTP